MRVKLKHKKHKISKWIVRLGGLPFKLFPTNFQGWADDKITMGAHAVTHIDAPWHYGPLCENKKAKTVDEIPLEWCYGQGKVIDMTHKNDCSPVTIKDIEEISKRDNITINPMDIIFIKTGRDKYIKTKNYYNLGPGVTSEATEWLIDKGIKVMGIDQWGWDEPLRSQIKKAKQTKNKELFWEAHLVGIKKEYCHIEQLVNLDKLPTSGFTVSVFPIKISGASAAPIRAVAILNDNDNKN